MYERYLSDSVFFSAGYFYKQIIDPVYDQSYSGTYNGGNVTYFSPLNGDNAWISGFEFAFNTDLAFAGAWGENFGISGNMTFQDSEMSTATRENVSIPRQADSLYNFAIFYDDATFAARLAVNHKGAYIESHSSKSADYDTYYGDFTSVDATASYYINDNAMIYVELNNLTDEALEYYTGSPERPNQIEYYGIRGQVGIKYDFF